MFSRVAELPLSLGLGPSEESNSEISWRPILGTVKRSRHPISVSHLSSGFEMRRRT